ncbi:type II secretion system protein [Candidatus Gracilibacteria bacterium]|nr:type II secretion system protein [Candidatus Gracilibacteria bacterium]
MKKVQKGFTLVELIVVITILAILGTIAFISLQGYSQDAKNSKVTSDLRTLTSAVETGISDGTVTLGNVVNQTTGSGNTLASTAVYYSGATTVKTISGALASGNYKVGAVNFAALQQNGDNFSYAVGNTQRPYVMSVLIDGDLDSDTATRDGYAVYQIAGQIPQADGVNFNSAVTGNFFQVDGSAIDGIIATPTITTGIVNNQNISGGLVY